MKPCRLCRTHWAWASVLALTLGASPPAHAHPLGNFTVNRCAQIAVSPNTLVLTYTVDYAEVPAFQEIGRFPALAADLGLASLRGSPSAKLLETDLAESWLRGLDLRIDAEPIAALSSVSHKSLTFVAGAGGLPTIRLQIQIETPLREASAARIEYLDNNAPGRLGWREIFVNPLGSRRVRDKSAPFENRSDGLTNYPNDPAQPLPQETEAAFTLEPVVPDATGPTADPGPIPTSPSTTRAPALDRLATLVHLGHGEPLSAQVLIGALLTAMALGATHALSPGHGKTIVGAYLVGSRGTAWHAAYLGAVVTLAHTLGVFALGLLTLLASRYVLPETLYPWLSFVSGALVALIGATLFHQRIEMALGINAEHRHLFWKHSHIPPAGAKTGSAIGLEELTALGVSGGLVPCPSAILVLLAAVSLHRIALGLALIVAFSVGLSIVLIALGLMFVYAGQRLSSVGFSPAALNALGIVSALVVTLLGGAIAYSALIETGALRLRLGLGL